MRKLLLFILLLLTTIVENNCLYAQAKHVAPLPDWIFEKPQRTNATFYYHIEKGTGDTETEARNAAYTQAFMQVALKLGIPLNTEDISEAVANGTNVKLLSQRFTIPMNVVCYYSRRSEESGGWNYWLLCQIPEMGYADRVRFDDYSECFKHELYDKSQREKALEAERQKQENLRTIHNCNTKAIIASSFIPGMGQMLKGQGGSGAAFLVGELALFGGGTACYFLGKNQLETMQAVGTSYADYQSAKKTKGTLDIAMYTCFGVGAAVHVANMVHAWYVKDSKLDGLAFYPVLTPTNVYSTPSYAAGVCVQYKF